ncbi:M48 family metallopeptidase [Sulfurospirillum sp. T05]|uniref:M48 family metallopeptidase n=1 Tax=Sulfurospirillum tamanense TaxID=2813362 RepID=A0ABS2WT44_9BACT|nr:M48 family metallopeptidase [Sulfurospirillum tamanensis]MBN2964344.1 M48 family metallopeptidase [Sulfurospirillum tamanensis]
MLSILGTLYFVYVLIKLYIATQEIGFVAKAQHQNAVILSPSSFLKAARYKIASERFGMVSTLVDYGLFLFWIGYGLRTLEGWLITNGGVWESVVFVYAFIGVNYLVGLPLDIYSTFFKDKAFGFSTIDAKTYALDQLKAMALFVVAGGAIVALVAWIILSFASWWLWGFGAIFAVVLFINMIYPTLIAPIFNRFTPLENPELSASIESLLQKAGLKSSGVFMIDASKRDKRLNAYFGGLGKSKRVVLFDTLVEKLSKSELLAVLGHELGHFKHKDMLKNVAMSAFMLLVMFGLFGNLPASVYEALHVSMSPHSTIALFLLLSPLVSFVMMPLFGAMSRHNEYAADAYGSACESKEALKNALMKLADENKSFPMSHPLQIAFYHTHPPLVERLKRLE